MNNSVKKRPLRGNSGLKKKHKSGAIEDTKVPARKTAKQKVKPPLQKDSEKKTSQATTENEAKKASQASNKHVSKNNSPVENKKNKKHPEQKKREHFPKGDVPKKKGEHSPKKGVVPTVGKKNLLLKNKEGTKKNTKKTTEKKNQLLTKRSSKLGSIALKNRGGMTGRHMLSKAITLKNKQNSVSGNKVGPNIAAKKKRNRTKKTDIADTVEKHDLITVDDDDLSEVVIIRSDCPSQTDANLFDDDISMYDNTSQTDEVIADMEDAVTICKGTFHLPDPKVDIQKHTTCLCKETLEKMDDVLDTLKNKNKKGPRKNEIPEINQPKKVVYVLKEIDNQEKKKYFRRTDGVEGADVSGDAGLANRSSMTNESGMENEASPNVASSSKTPMTIKKVVPDLYALTKIIPRNPYIEMPHPDSVEIGTKMFQWILHPYGVQDFMKHSWEKQPCCIPRKKPRHFLPLITSTQIDKMLRTNNLHYTKHVDIAIYSDGERETRNLEGRALPHAVWEFYKNNCSVRLLNPQYFSKNIHLLNSALQEYFGCFVGANIYLTPPASQGFAPHYDDIEAFVLQIEGRKHWKIYEPRTEKERLPEYSSKNLDEASLGDPCLEVTLKAGDTLYFPRGYIHQAYTDSDSHSLHITVSMYQLNSWGTLLKSIIPAALETALEKDIDYRKGLPINYLKSAGFSYAGNRSDVRNQLCHTVNKLFHRLANYINLDMAVDELGVQFMHDALPPVLTSREKPCTSTENSLRMKDGEISNKIQLQPFTKLRLIREYICRLTKQEIEEDDENEIEYRLYYTASNSIEYHKEDPLYVVIPYEFVRFVQYLIVTYPEFVTVTEALSDIKEKDEFNCVECEIVDVVQLMETLWERGLILTSEPIPEIMFPEGVPPDDTTSHND